MNITIGKKIEKEFIRSGMTKAAFAKKIGMSRNNIYYLFERESVGTQLLEEISKALGHDFFQYYADNENEDNIVKEDRAIYSKPKKKSRLSLLIELDPDADILSNKQFIKRLNDLMEIVSE